MKLDDVTNGVVINKEEQGLMELKEVLVSREWKGPAKKIEKKQ